MFWWWRTQISTAAKTVRIRIGAPTGRPTAARGSNASNGAVAEEIRAASDE